jgi:uncharacterized cupredoxin-like copper-binding protein
MARALRCCLVAGVLLAAAFALAACGGGSSRGGQTPTGTKVATKAATQQIANTPTAALTPTLPAATEAGAQPSATAMATKPSAATNTPPSAHETTLDVSLSEFHVTPSIGTGSAGTVTFNVSNNGTIPHDFLVIKTDVAADALPVDSATFQVRVSELNVVKSQPAIASGTSVQVTVDLSAGHYVLICNIASHYQTGMHAAFTVE